MTTSSRARDGAPRTVDTAVALRSRERRVRGDVALGVGEDLGGLGNRSVSMSTTGGRGVGLDVDRVRGRGDHVLVGVADRRQDVAGEVDLAALPGGAAEDAGDRGLQPAVSVGDHEAYTVEATVAKRVQERGLEHFVFGVADIETEHFTVAVDRDGGRHDAARPTMRCCLQALML